MELVWYCMKNKSQSVFLGYIHFIKIKVYEIWSEQIVLYGRDTSQKPFIIAFALMNNFMNCF